jgi:hypothetical protein
MFRLLAADCQLDPPGDPTVFCGDSNALGGPDHDVVARSDAFLGPLTLRYEFDRDLEIDPQSEGFGVFFGGAAHLIYSLVPEPGTGLLVMTGLLGLAWRQRRPAWPS